MAVHEDDQRIETAGASQRAAGLAGMELLVGAIDSHVHCAPHINRRSVTAFEAVRSAAAARMRAIGIMDVFANTSGLADLVNIELGHLGVEAFGGIILEPYVGGVTARTVRTAISMGYGGGARFVSLPCHHTDFVGRAEGRSPAYLETCLSVPDRGELPGELGEIMDLCSERDVVFNTGHLHDHEHVRIVEEACSRGVERVLVPASYLSRDTAAEVVSLGATIEFSFFVLSHATQLPQTMIDAEYHRFALVDLADVVATIKATDPSSVVLSSDSGAIVLAPPVEAFRELLVMLQSCGIGDDALRQMSQRTPSRLFGIDLSDESR